MINKDDIFINEHDKYTVTISAFYPISKIIKDHNYNYNHIHKIYHNNKHWYENMNADNNLFSVEFQYFTLKAYACKI